MTLHALALYCFRHSLDAVIDGDRMQAECYLAGTNIPFIAVILR